MPVNLSIKNAPDALARKLRKRASKNHRSLQGELMAIISEAVEKPPSLTIQEVWQRARKRGLSTRREAAEIVRADRDSH